MLLFLSVDQRGDDIKEVRWPEEFGSLHCTEEAKGQRTTSMGSNAILYPLPGVSLVREQPIGNDTPPHLAILFFSLSKTQ